MSVVLAVPRTAQILEAPPTHVDKTDVWLAIPAVYSVPPAYIDPVNTIRNYGKDIWVEFLPEEVKTITIEDGEAEITFFPSTGIQALFDDDDENFIPVAVSGYIRSVLDDSVLTSRLYSSQAIIYSINILEADEEDLEYIPIQYTEGTEEVDNNNTPTNDDGTPVVSPTTVEGDTPVTTTNWGGFRIPLFGTIGDTNVNSSQLFQSAGGDLRNLLRGQIGGSSVSNNTAWRDAWTQLTS